VLFRERIVLTLLFLFGFLSFVDLFTTKGNEFWERYIGFPGRYAVMQGDKTGYVNGRCRLVIRPLFDGGAAYFKGGMSPVSVGKKWGYIDTAGKWIIQPQFFWAGEFKEGRAAISYYVPERRSVKYGFIDETGAGVVPGPYARVRDFSEGAAGVMTVGLWGFIDKDGRWLSAQRFEDVGDFSDGLAAAREKGLWGFVDKSGIFLVRPQFEEVKPFSEEVAAVKINSKWGYIDRRGQWILKPQWSSANSFSDGLAIADAHYIDHTGKIVINGGNFGQLTDFSEGFAAVEVPAKTRYENSKWGYIDRTGKFLIAPRFEIARSFKGGLARVTKERTPARLCIYRRQARLGSGGLGEIRNILPQHQGRPDVFRDLFCFDCSAVFKKPPTPALLSAHDQLIGKV
jgi:hypothetical protein